MTESFRSRYGLSPEISFRQPTAWHVFAAVAGLIAVPTAIQHLMRVPLTTDAAWWVYLGRMVASGQAVPYVDLWIVKPPGTVWIAAAAALIGGGPVTTFAVDIGLSIAAPAGTAALLYRFGKEVGESRQALVAPAAFLLFYRPWFRPAYGLAPKQLLALTAVAGIYCIYRERWLAAGAVTTLAAWQWQAAAVLVAAGLVHAYANRCWRQYVVGAAVVSAAVIVPLVIMSPIAAVAMASQIFLPTIVTSEAVSIADRIWALPFALGYALIPMLVGLAALMRHGREWLWLTVPTFVLLGIVLVADFDGAADLMLPYTISLVGVALAASQLDRWQATRLTIGIIIVVTAVAIPTTLGGEPVRDNIDAVVMVGDPLESPSIPSDPWEEGGDLRLLYANKLPDRCHVRLSRMEQRYIAATPAEVTDQRCGAQAW